MTALATRRPPVKLTAAILDALEIGERRNDTDARGLYAERGPQGVHFRWQKDLRLAPGKATTVRLAAGHWTGKGPSLTAARAKANEWSAQVKQGIDPRQTAPAAAGGGAGTLAAHYEAYLRDATSERTARDLTYRLDRYLGGASSDPEHDTWPRTLAASGGDWRGRTVAEIAPHIRARFEAIRDNCGQHSANRTMRDLRAVLRHAKAEPVVDAALGDRAWRAAKKAERAQRTYRSVTDLRGWYGRLQGLPDDWRRRFHLVNLLSGARPSMVCALEVAWVDAAARLVRFPGRIMKTGEPFDLPLSDWLLALLGEQIAERAPRRLPPAAGGGEVPWVFPVKQRGGRIGPARFWREKGMTNPESKVQEVGYALRHTYASLALDTPGVSYADREMLMARAMPGAGAAYNHPRERLEALLVTQQRITDEFRRRLGA